MKNSGLFNLNDKKVKTPFRYAGGKYYALKYLLPYIAQIPHEEFREPFVGGGSVFFGKPKVKKNWINDIDAELINTYKVMQDPVKHKELITLLENEIATPDRHTQVKESNPRSDIDRAFKYFYLNRTSYSGIMKKPAWGYRDDKSSPPKNWGAMIKNVHEKLKDVKITSLDFMEILLAPSSSKVLFYLDPPYLEADQKRAYKNHFLSEDHRRLSEALKKCKHSFILSYDNIDSLKEIYSWATIIELTWNYNTSNIKGKERMKGKEIIITNIPFPTLKVQNDYIQPRLL
ncbi:MAG: M2.BsrBI [Parcubacteria group bacterium GW2011_GWC1_35_21]|nr:MAG: M2.BsrBI [Parcubacteria group bacterium GW2011_GWC1_35_21]